MRPDERDLDEEIRGHLAISVKERIERGEDPEAARLAALREFGYMPRDARSRCGASGTAAGSTPSTRSRRTCAVGIRSLLRAKGLAATVVDHARARHRRQRRDLQRRPRRAAAAARQSRRGSPDLHPSERAGPRHREHDVLGAGDPRLQGARHDHRRVRRILDDRLHDDRPRRAARRARRRRRRLVLRGDGPSARARPAAQRRPTMARTPPAPRC